MVGFVVQELQEVVRRRKQKQKQKAKGERFRHGGVQRPRRTYTQDGALDRVTGVGGVGGGGCWTYSSLASHPGYPSLHCK